jgi:type IX secretion system substrate protein/Kelch motif protein
MTYLSRVSRFTFHVLFCALCVQNISFPQSGMRYVSFSEAPFSHWMFYGGNDTINGTWYSISPLAQPLYGVNSYYWQDSGKVFVCGGANAMDIPQASCYFFDPLANIYTPKASLPTGRALGKIVRVRDSLYLVGSVGSWHSPDGLIYKYDPHANSWTVKAVMPTPFLHESAVCVWRDSLIFIIGGARNGFTGATNIVRVYNPETDRWRVVSQNSFPVVVTTAHSECLGDSIAVVGGFGTDYLNTVYKGRITADTTNDTIRINWSLYNNVTPFGFGVYRVGGGKWNDVMLFGPAMRFQNAFNQIWACSVSDTSWAWSRFNPGSLDSAGNRPTIAVSQNDSVHFFLFGGFANPNVIARSEQYSFYPVPIGIISNNNKVPEDYFLSKNYPNPFNPVTRIKFGIPENSLSRGVAEGRDALVSLSIYDVLGRQIAILVNRKLSPGTYEIEWNAGNSSSGVYFYRLSISDYNITKKMVLLK